MRKRWQAKLLEVKTELRRRLHDPIPEQGAHLRAVVGGHNRYYGIPGNGARIGAFHQHVTRLWIRSLRRRSQRHRMPWERFRRYVDRWIPPPRICHPPSTRFDVTTGGRSRMR